MAKRGPPPKPSALLDDGNWRKKKRKNEPKPKVEAPSCPDWLPAEAKEEWNRIVPILIEMKILTGADRVCLENYCLAYGRAVQMQRFIDEHGYSYSTETGFRKYPEVGILEQAQQLMKGFLSEFGLSPASRSRVAATEPENEAAPKDEKFFQGRDTSSKAVLKVIG